MPRKNLRIFKNKRLYFCLSILWLIASFFIIRGDAIKAADAKLEIDLAYCYEIENFTSQSCVDDAMKLYWGLLEITPTQLIDMVELFAGPILLIVFLVAVIKWIRNYKY